MMGTKKVGALSSPLQKSHTYYIKMISIVKKKIKKILTAEKNLQNQGNLSNLYLT
ncbi:MAG: hypothetical protein GF421_07835 [Candidatus Aminicenantes bacterium]|nr:hypothetical protein [Candidatus Aminicenantes bacterium]